MEKKKILYLITKSNWGGAQRYVYDLATNLPQEFEPVVALGGTGEKDAPEGLLATKLREKNIKVIFVKNFLRDISLIKEVLALSELTTILKAEKPDILHLNSSKAGGVGALAARRAGVRKIIFTVHGWAFNENRPFLVKYLLWIASWLTVLLVTKVIVLGERERNQTLKMPVVSASKILKIRIGVDNIAMLDRKSARISLGAIGSSLNNIWIGTIAEMHRNKGLEHLISAVGKIKTPVTLCIIGEGEEEERLRRQQVWFILELVKAANRRIKESRVLFAGFRPGAASYLSAFDVFVLPSIKEGLPYVILESGLAGLPVVATEVGGIPEVIKDGENGFLVPPGKPELLAEKLSEITENPELRKRLGKNFERHVRKEFSLTKMVEKTIELYR